MQQRAVIQAVLAHLERHPSAADSAAGVARWWLSGAGPALSVETVEPVLALMVRRGLLRRIEVAGGSSLYARPVAGSAEAAGVVVPLQGRRGKGGTGAQR